MEKDLKVGKLIGNIARRSKTRGFSTLATKNKTEQALIKDGFSQKKAKKISASIRKGARGTYKATGKEAGKIIKALKKEKVIKGYVKDVKGEVSRFKKEEQMTPKAELEKQERIKKRNINRRKRSDKMEDEKKAGKGFKNPPKAGEEKKGSFKSAPIAGGGFGPAKKKNQEAGQSVEQTFVAPRTNIKKTADSAPLDSQNQSSESAEEPDDMVID